MKLCFLQADLMYKVDISHITKDKNIIRSHICQF